MHSEPTSPSPFDTTPPELVSQIFAWLPPEETFPLHLLSKRFHAILSTPHFQQLNARNALWPLIFFEPHNASFDRLFFLFPPTYQHECAKALNAALKKNDHDLLDWSDLSLEGSRLPAAIDQLTFFQGFHIRGTPLSGPIPPQLGTLQNLTTLEFVNNHLTGAIPHELGALVNLETLDLSWNLLSGQIPASLGRCVHLHSLFVRSNRITGPLPVELFTLPKLRAFDAGKNPLGGALQVGWTRLPKLEEVFLDECELEGEVPREFAGEEGGGGMPFDLFIFQNPKLALSFESERIFLDEGFPAADWAAMVAGGI
ncbi:hypothetical protein HDU98_011481 [Podochytrium sp. JEL0797]|nr:hypothetical protein HDU98_011481 [Podochytrium sp. JEL0797]